MTEQYALTDGTWVGSYEDVPLHDVAVSFGDVDGLLPSSSRDSTAGRSNLRAPWASEVRSRLAEMSSWHAGWDGYGSSAVMPEAVAEAVSFLSMDIWRTSPAPFLGVSSRGGVEIEWESPGAAVHVTLGEGHPSLFLLDKQTGQRWEGALGTEPDGLAKWAWKNRVT